MRIDKLFPGLERIDNGDYVLDGNLISDETIEIDLDDRFVVKGKIVSNKSITVRCGIKAVWCIEAGYGIKAGWDIEAGWGIKAVWGIEAGEGIKAGCGIEAGEGIEAGCGIKAVWGIEAGYGIEAGEGIEAGWGIKAGWDIEAGSFLSSKKRIFAGTSIYHTNKDCNKEIRCTELRDGEVCYGDLILTGSEGKPDEN